MRTFHECLLKKTVAELTDIGFRLLVMPPDNRRSKEAWATAIEKTLREEPENLHPALNGTQWEDLHGMLESVPEDAPEISLPLSDTVRPLMERLASFGLAWHDRKAWHLQAELLRGCSVFKTEESEMLTAAEYWFDVLTGYVLLYGLILFDDLLVMLQLENDRPTAEAMLSVWRARNGLDGILAEDGRLWLLCPDATEPARLYAARQDPELSLLAYKPMTQEEALELSDTLLPGDPKDAQAIRGFFRRRGLEPKEIDDLLVDMTEYVQNNDTDSALSLLSDALDSMPTPEQVEMIGDYINSMPRWELKGHSYAELNPRKKPPRPKQNDPCPCGSGRKYKNCCGRLQ